MAEECIEISNADGAVALPDDICCNCSSSDRVRPVESDLKLTRFLGLGGSEYTFTWALPLCPGCEPTARRTPIGKLHIAMVIGLVSVVLFMASTLIQGMLEMNVLGGYDFQAALVLAIVGVGGFYVARKPSGAQTSWYQPIRIRKLRQSFTSGEVTGMVLGFTSTPYARQFRQVNSGSITR